MYEIASVNDNVTSAPEAFAANLIILLSPVVVDVAEAFLTPNPAPNVCAPPIRVSPLAPKVVKLPAAGVVAPTVPLMLMEAVPVRLVTVPLAGVPKTGAVIVGEVKVLFVSVSVVALPTKVSVAAGSVTVVVPATAEACSVVVPLVDPDKSIALGLRVTVVAIMNP